MKVKCTEEASLLMGDGLSADHSHRRRGFLDYNRFIEYVYRVCGLMGKKKAIASISVVLFCTFKTWHHSVTSNT